LSKGKNSALSTDGPQNTGMSGGKVFTFLLKAQLHLMQATSVYSQSIKGLVHPKMKILSVFTHPRVVPNLYVFICSAEHKRRYLEECFNQTDLIPH